MTICEMCGRSGNLVSAVIEGVPLTVCDACARYGAVSRPFSTHLSTSLSPRGNVLPPQQKSHFLPRSQPEYRVIDSYASLIRNIREKRGMTQKDFALLLQEKESFISKWESGALKPDLETAKKLQKILNLTLVVLDDNSVEPEKVEKTKSSEFTLGDFIKVRPAKKI